MLKKRLIPKLLIKKSKNNNPVLVTSFQFEKYVGDPIFKQKF